MALYPVKRLSLPSSFPSPECSRDLGPAFRLKMNNGLRGNTPVGVGIPAGISELGFDGSGNLTRSSYRK